MLTPRELLLGGAISFGLAAVLLRLGTRVRPVARGKSGRPPLPQDSFAGIGAVFWLAIGFAAAGGAAELAAPPVVITMSAVCGLLVTAAYTVASRHTADLAGSSRTRWNPNQVRPGASPVRQQ